MLNLSSLPYGVSLERLNTLCEISEKGSISALAEQGHKKQSLISRQIIELEAALGFKLLDRSTKPHQLTSAALEIEQSVRSFYRQFQEAQQRATNHQETLIIGAGESLILWYLMPLLAKSPLWKKYQIHFRNMQSSQAIDSLKRGHIDFAIHNGKNETSDLPTKKVDYYSLCLVADPSIKFTGQKLAWKDLPKAPLISIGGGGSTHERIMDLTRKHPEGPFLSIECTSHQQVLEMSQQTKSMGVIPNYGSKKAQKLGLQTFQIKELSSEKIPLNASWQRSLSDPVKDLLSLLKL